MNPIFSSVLPVFLLVALGTCLRRLDFVDRAFFRTSDWLVYFVSFPVMLFWKIGAPSSAAQLDGRLILAVMAAVTTVYVLSLGFVRITRMPDFQVGSFSQCCYRFNTYIGMAVVVGICGEQGVTTFGVIIAFAIPFINFLAVSTLIWFSAENYSLGQKTQFLGRSLLSNPLLIACFLGLLYARLGVGFAPFVNNSFALLSSLSLPLALLSIGNSLTFAGMRGHLALSLAAAAFKLALLPLVGALFLHALEVTGVPFMVAMTFFLLPTSSAIFILSAQLKSDIELASVGIMVSTVLSLFSLSVGLWWLRA